MDKSERQKMYTYFSFQPAVGVTISIALVFYYFFVGAPRTWNSTLYILVPTVTLFLIYFLLRLFLGQKIAMSPKIRTITTIWTISLALFLGMFVMFKPNLEIEKITLNDIEGISEVFNKDDYYLIYSADSCVYCQKMKPVYEASFFRFNKDENVYIVDLSAVQVQDERFSELDVSKIPSLRQYSKGEETKRIDGVKSLEEINQFVDGEG